MAIVGFNFNKINAEKNETGTGKINISNDVAVKDITKQDMSLGKSKQGGLNFAFEFTSKYEPKLGSMVLGGNVLVLEDEAKVKEILDGWKKNKAIPQDLMSQVLNMALTKCNIQALILSQTMNLPPPVPLPKVNIKKK